MMDLIVAVGVAVVALMTYWVIAMPVSDLQDRAFGISRGGKALWTAILLLIWGAIALGVIERIRTGRYPTALLRLLGFRSTRGPITRPPLARAGAERREVTWIIPGTRRSSLAPPLCC